jgi:hypothetical protein
MPGANDDLAAVVRAWVKQHSPGSGKVHIEVDLTDGNVDRLAVDWKPAATANVGARVSADPLADFKPTDAQLAVLEALECKALKTPQLEAATGLEHSHLFKALRGLRRPLLDPPLVDIDKKLGYYRPDAPPPEELL